MTESKLPVAYDPTEDTEGQLTHIISRLPYETDKITLYPADVDGMTEQEWISAEGDDFVCLSECQ